MKFNHVVCGGTFDHLHAGHKELLKACFRAGKRISVGLTTRAMVRHKLFSNSIESYAIRESYITRFAASRAAQVSVIKLTDIYGTTLTDGTIDAIYVTKETFPGAEKINEQRVRIGMKPLSIIIIPFALDENGERIASEKIRQGIIDRNGISYYRYLISKEIFYLPDSLKRVLRNPLGRVIPSIELLSEILLHKMKDKNNKQSYITHIAVGDMVTYHLKRIGISPLLSIIDGITLRKALNKKLLDSILEKDCYNSPNKNGTIQKEAVTALYGLFSLFLSGHKDAPKQLLIEGEEDLLTLVSILFAPLKSHVWYGQKDKGAIDVLVTENKKQIVYNLLQQFKSVETSYNQK